MYIPERAIRIYSDTTVFGGIVDPEFEEASNLFFERDGINGMKGYAGIAIYSPLEVIGDD